MLLRETLIRHSRKRLSSEMFGASIHFLPVARQLEHIVEFRARSFGGILSLPAVHQCIHQMVSPL